MIKPTNIKVEAEKLYQKVTDKVVSKGTKERVKDNTLCKDYKY